MIASSAPAARRSEHSTDSDTLSPYMRRYANRQIWGGLGDPLY